MMGELAFFSWNLLWIKQSVLLVSLEYIKGARHVSGVRRQKNSKRSNILPNPNELFLQTPVFHTHSTPNASRSIVQLISVLCWSKTVFSLPEKKSMGMPRSRDVLNGVTRLIEFGWLVITCPLRPIIMRCASDDIDVPPIKCESWEWVAAFKFRWDQRLRG